MAFLNPIYANLCKFMHDVIAYVTGCDVTADVTAAILNLTSPWCPGGHFDCWWRHVGWRRPFWLMSHPCIAGSLSLRGYRRHGGHFDRCWRLLGVPAPVLTAIVTLGELRVALFQGGCHFGCYVALGVRGVTGGSLRLRERSWGRGVLLGKGVRDGDHVTVGKERGNAL